MVVHYDQLTDELQRTKLKFSEELIFSPQRYGDESYVHIEVPSKSKFYRVRFAEYAFMSMLDGNTSLAHALSVVSQNLGTCSLSESEAEQLVDWLLENELAHICDQPGTHNGSTNQKSAQAPSVLQRLNPFWLKLPLGCPEAALKRISPFLKWCFHPACLWLTSLFILATLGLLMTEYQAVLNSASNLLSPQNMLAALVAWVGLKLVHEFAHAMTCHYFGGKVKETGVIFILFAPMAYVDATSSLRFKSREKRMAVAGAGMFVELLIASLCVWAWFLVSSELMKQQLTNIIFAAGFSTILFNANPLMRFDGYFLLSDVLNIPNLYTSGSAAIKRQARWLFLGQMNESSILEIRTREGIVAMYGYLALIWRLLVCVGLFMAASVLFHGLGVFLALLGIAIWFAKPVCDGIQILNQTRKTRPHGFFRAVTVGLILLTVGLGCCLMPNPFATRAACLVDFEDGAKIRVACEGTVEEVFVAEGEWVEKGQPILRMENRELIAAKNSLQSEAEAYLTQESIALDAADPGSAHDAKRNYQATLESLQEKTRECQQLMVRAPKSGYVIAPCIEQFVGKFVEKGEHLLSVSNLDTKQIVVAVSPSDVDAKGLRIGEELEIEIGIRRRFKANIRKITPRAKKEVTQPKLIATNGGELVVQRTQDDSQEKVQLLDPHFEVVASIEPAIARQLFVGERGQSVLRSSSSSLGGYAFQKLQAWLETQYQIAASTQE